MKISISKALKLKNRLGARIKKVQGKIRAFNSMDARKRNPVDVRAEMEELKKLNGLIITLKVAIYQSNAAICGNLITMSELRQHQSFLAGIDTTEGHVETYSDTEKICVCTISYEEAEGIIEEVEKSIRQLQDEMDQHNAKTMIEVPDGIADYE